MDAAYETSASSCTTRSHVANDMTFDFILFITMAQLCWIGALLVLLDVL